MKNSNNCMSLFPISFNKLQELVQNLGFENYRAKQLWNWFTDKLEFDLNKMTNIPIILKSKLKEKYPNILPLVKQKLEGKDKTIKIGFELDGKLVEAVAIVNQEDKQVNTYTFCLSSQIGCPIGCLFCYTGQQKFIRNLSAEEIFLQYLLLASIVNIRPSNIVYMGMGEPFLNLKEVAKSLDIFRSIKFSQRRITISTVGIPEKILELAKSYNEVNLAISLHSADDEIRKKIIPISKKYTVLNIKEAVAEYINKTNRRVTFEVTLLKEVNDSKADAQNLANYCKGLLCHINIIRFNPFPGSKFEPSPVKREKEFITIIRNSGIPVTVRKSKGSEILAGCGQLSSIKF